jgi:hypothetical protein
MGSFIVQFPCISRQTVGIDFDLLSLGDELSGCPRITGAVASLLSFVEGAVHAGPALPNCDEQRDCGPCLPRDALQEPNSPEEGAARDHATLHFRRVSPSR